LRVSQIKGEKARYQQSEEEKKNKYNTITIAIMATQQLISKNVTGFLLTCHVPACRAVAVPAAN
jgi:hypothetical protein